MARFLNARALHLYSLQELSLPGRFRRVPQNHLEWHSFVFVKIWQAARICTFKFAFSLSAGHFAWRPRGMLPQLLLPPARSPARHREHNNIGWPYFHVTFGRRAMTFCAHCHSCAVPASVFLGQISLLSCSFSLEKGRTISVSLIISARVTH